MSSQPDTAPSSEENVETFGSLFTEFFHTLKIFCSAILVSMWRFFIPPPRKSVQGEIVLVTGAGSGMGRQLAMEFGKLGSVLVLWDINESGLKDTAEMLRSINAKCSCYVCDVGNKEEVHNIGKKVKKEVGDVTILVNNAGTVCGKKLLNTPDHLVQRQFNVNLMAHFWTVKCFLPTMLRNNHGHIVNISSSTGLIGINKLATYCTSKFGVVGFTEVLNYEIVFSGHSGVHTTLVCPSFVNTGMFQGCKMRFPWILPALETQRTVDRIMQGILTNQHIICIPRLVYFFTFLKSILPVDAFHEIIRFFGAATFMDTYVGKENHEFEVKDTGNASDTVDPSFLTNGNHN